MTLSDLSIKRPVFAWVLFIGVLLFGAISYSRLGVSMMPDVDFPVLDIRVEWEGAAPEVLETELVDQIEEEMLNIEGLKEIRSSIQQGRANIKLEFDINRDVDAALQEAQGALSQVRLPLNVDMPVIRKSNPEEDPIMWIAFGGDRTLHELVRYIDLNVLDQLKTVPGVGEIILGGFSARNLRIWIDNDKLRQYQLTVLDVVDAIDREHAELAGGYIENPKKEINVRTMGEEFSPEQVAEILITTRGGQPVYDPTIRLKDVARIEDGLEDIRAVAIISGIEGIGVSLGIKKQRKQNEIEVADAVHKKVAEIRKNLPKDLDMRVNVDFTDATRTAIKKTQIELFMSVILTTLVCFLFLGSWKSAINVILAIPFSVFGTFIVLYFMNFTLNLFTLLALALAIGIVVDDAIMMLENIVRHFQMGKGRKEASRVGAREITFAAVATTAALVAIFLPVVFMQGIIGKFFFQFGIALSSAVVFSLIEAITLTPMRCSRFMTDSDHNSRFAERVNHVFAQFASVYSRSLAFVLAHRIKVLVVSTALFIVSTGLVGLLRKEFVPRQDQNVVRIQFQAPVGSSLENTRNIAAQIARYLDNSPYVERYFMRVGGGGGGAPSNRGFAGVILKPRSQRDIGHLQFMDITRETLLRNPDTKIDGLVRLQMSDISDRGLTAGRSSPVAFNIRGADYNVLKEKIGEIEKRLQATGLVEDLDTDYREGQPELRILPKREEAALRGVSMQNIGRTINAAVGGIRQGKFTNDGRRYDIRIRLEPEERLNPDDIKKLHLRTQYGEIIPLSDVVDLDVINTVQTVTRVNRQKSVSVFGNLATGASQSDALARAEQIAREVLPEGYSFHLEGGAQTFGESFDALYFVLFLGIAFAYLVLAVQFNSFIHPVTILLALPFSMTGAWLALYLTGQSLNMFSFIGILLLMGVVKKNSILLVEFTNQLRRRGLPDVHDALMKACPIRLRPILMTSIATVGAAIPLAIGLGDGAESRRPMALAVIGGVLLSTLLTLYVVPCAYSLLSRFEKHDDDEDASGHEHSPPEKN
ncbi:efflux RND transporter permease subunit [Oscillatoria laete-virens NRMC-F 0139]|nr:efflux RND transporter permease subunit [Oscillatoria laete-virens]MDL5053916.1 efflux RND transporter permease subunit [Oscillatoria laete-virens NRMC-F 0139]